MTEAPTLRPLLSSDWKLATAVASEAEALGLTRDQIRAARKALGVTREMGGVARRDGRWWWRLPDGCPTCGRSWRERWTLEGQGGDYYAHGRPSSPVMPKADPVVAPDDEPASPTLPPSSVSRLEPSRPPVCDRCGKTSAMNPGEPCPWRPTGRLCGGTMR